MSRYDYNTANSARIVRFRIEPEDAGDRDAALFGMLRGRTPGHPRYGQLATTPTANEELAQLRTDLVVQALKAYAVPVGVYLAEDAAGTGSPTANFGSALDIWFETDESGVFFNQAWAGDTTVAKHDTADLVDELGTGGAPGGAKTKDGLNSLLQSLSTVTYDGGTTGPFGAISTSGAIVLPDGQTTSGAPTLAAGGTATGLAIALLA